MTNPLTLPLLQREIDARLTNHAAKRPLLLAIAGAQGSGKSALVEAYRQQSPHACAAFSLDDVYLGQADRNALATLLHPLLKTRGVPGTHDMVLLRRTLDDLNNAAATSRTRIPSFDKRTDAPRPSEDWPTVRGRPDVILLDGWCLGATPQSDAQLAAPINDLETARDPDATWRRYVNDKLVDYARELWPRFDALIYLRPPSFDIVLDWRAQQQAALLGRALGPDERADLGLFVQHFERLTRHMIAGGVAADVIVDLSPTREIRDIRRPIRA